MPPLDSVEPALPQPGRQPSPAVRRVTSDWFTTADALGDDLVPGLADWCAVHVREPITAALRTGATGSLIDLGLAVPVDGERLDMVTLRHRDPERELIVRQWAVDVPVRVGDRYGAGRVTASGVTRYLPQVGPTMLQTVGTIGLQRSQFERLGIGSSIVVPLRTSAGVLLGAMTLLRELAGREAFTEQHVAQAEWFATRAADALDEARIATVAAHAVTGDLRADRAAVWRPARPNDPATSTDGRHWARRTLPDIITGPPRPELFTDMDLVFTELISNAIRHGGGLREAQLLVTGEHLRMVAADNDPRRPAVRAPQVDQPGGRGLHLIQSIADRWGVHRHHTEVGKRVWADLRLAG